MSNADSISTEQQAEVSFHKGVAKRQRDWAWIWLCYTGFLFIDPIVNPSLYLWLVTMGAFFVFLVLYALYVRATDKGSPLRFWLIGAIFVLGLIVFPLNQGASTFFVYATSFLPFALDSNRRIFSLFATAVLIVFAEGYLLHGHHGILYINWPNTYVAVFLMLIIGTGNTFFAEQRRADCRLREAQAENLALAAVAERERIARDLHDVLGHTLSVIVLKAELAGRLMERDPKRAAAEIADVESTARTALAEVREAIGGYRTKGLAAELAMARRTLDAAGVALTYEADELVSKSSLPATEETVLSLAVREAVTNIVRHAEATHCRMRLATTEDGFHALLVEDNGCHAVTQEGNGLRGMRERVQALGGRFSLKSGLMQGQGTALLVELPVGSGFVKPGCAAKGRVA